MVCTVSCIVKSLIADHSTSQVSAASRTFEHQTTRSYPIAEVSQILKGTIRRSKAVLTMDWFTGGRTAWSCVVTVQGANFPARFWYDGQYVNNAREDAAEKALQTLGVIASPPPRPAHLQHQQQHQPQQPQQQHQYQQSSRFYGGAINS